MSTRERRLRIEMLADRCLLASDLAVSAVGGMLFQSDGQFTLNNTHPIASFSNEAVEQEPSHPIAAADFTGDGTTDLLVVERSSQQASLHVNDGQQMYVLPWGKTAPPTAEIVGYSDLNHDGLLDVLSLDQSQNQLWGGINNLESGFEQQLWGGWEAIESDVTFVADFDGDGASDLLRGQRNGDWLLSRSNGTEFVHESWGTYPYYRWEATIAGDFTGDGISDVAARAPDHTWWVWIGSETGLLPAKYWGHWKMDSEWVDVRVADFNGDGKDDVIGRAESGKLWVATSTGDSFHTWQWATGWVNRADWQSIHLVDVTGDGLTDQIGQAADGTWWIAENQTDRFRNHYLGRGFEFIAAADQFRHEEAVDLSAVFGWHDLGESARDATRERNLAAYRARDARPVAVGQPETDEPNAESRMAYSLAEDGHIVIHAATSQAMALQIESNSSSLQTNEDPFPFDGYLARDESKVVLVTGDAGPASFSEAGVRLGVRVEDPADLHVRYYDAHERAWYSVSSREEESQAESVIEQTLPGDSPTSPIALFLDEQNRIVLSGSGQSIFGGIEIRSSAQALIPGTSPAPFEFFLSNNPSNIVLALWPGEDFVLDGEITLDVRWNIDVDLVDAVLRYELADQEGVTFTAAISN